MIRTRTIASFGVKLIRRYSDSSGIMNLIPFRSARMWGGVFLSGLLSLCGCQRERPLQFTPSQEVQKLSTELQQQINGLVEAKTGTALHPVLLGVKEQDPQSLKHGQAVYMRRCVQCHGVSGDGEGAVAGTMYPRPRDYRRGIFKFTSTPYGAKPRREDLIRTVKVGVPGTSMPTFDLLPTKEIEAVVDYVLMLTHRGELEFQLAAEAAAAEEVDTEGVDDLVAGIVDMWNEAEGQIVTPLTPQPVFTIENLQAGREAFLTRGCSKCHGEDGRGQTVDNLRGDLKDAWGFTTRAADLSSGMLHGGRQPEDIYRRIYSGINGTPMPGFSSAITDKPEEFWNLVSYVLYVSGKRRAGVIPTAGALDLNELIEQQKRMNTADGTASSPVEKTNSPAESPSSETVPPESPAAPPEEKPVESTDK